MSDYHCVLELWEFLLRGVCSSRDLRYIVLLIKFVEMAHNGTATFISIYLEACTSI
jgi:hypothetical protein